MLLTDGYKVREDFLKDWDKPAFVMIAWSEDGTGDLAAILDHKREGCI